MRLLKSEVEFETSVIDRIVMLEQRCVNYEKEFKKMKISIVMLNMEVQLLEDTLDDIEDSLTSTEE